MMDQDLVDWNDRMYQKHSTPYGLSIAGFISSARVRTVSKLAAIQHHDRVLELGCERGNLLLSLPSCKRLVGSDISPAAIADARLAAIECGRANTEFVQCDAQMALPFSKGEFDVIILSEMLEHVHDPRLVLANVRDIATPSTRVIITVPNENPKLVIKKILKAIGLMQLLFPGIEDGQSEWHLHRFSKPMIRKITAGLFSVKSLKSVYGCHYAARLKPVA